ncbi:MAG: protein kinase [Myxococcales bacterium]|nr:protein kinase [Myxococcales bacterium]
MSEREDSPPVADRATSSSSRAGSGGPSSYAEALNAVPVHVEDTLLASERPGSARPRGPASQSRGAEPEGPISGREETLAGSGVGPDSPPRAPPPRREAPAKIGRYLVIEPLGEGGMGVVFAAYDPQLDRKVAIKLVRPAYTESSGGEAQARLVREAQALARLRHPNIVTVYEVGPFDNEVYVAMEFVDGVTLRTWQFEQARGWRDILRVYQAAGRGLAAAHRAGLVHRDFKPDNVLVTRDGEPRVLDFGLAFRDAAAAVHRPSAAAPVADLTVTGALVGTPAYMSPEQHRGETVDVRTDVFAFAVALFEALYGTRPYAGATLIEISTALFEGRISPPPSFIKVPSWVRRAVHRGLKIDARERFQDMEALLRALGRDPRRYAAVAGAVAVVGAVIVGLVLALRTADSRQSLRDQGARARADFDHRRAELLEAELLRDRGRSAAEHFNSWVVEAARARLEVSPTDALAALKRLRLDGGGWAAARGVAAEALTRGVPEVVWSTPAPVTALMFVERERWVVVGDTKGRVELRARTGEVVAGFEHRAAIAGLSAAAAAGASGPRPGVRVAALADGEVLLWDAAADAVHRLAGEAGPVRSVALAPDGETLVIGADDGRVQVHTWAGAPVRGYERQAAAVGAIAWTNDGLTLATGAEDGAVSLWDVAAGGRRELGKLGAAVRELRFDDAGVLYSVAADRGGQVWIVEGERLTTSPVPDVVAIRAGARTRLDVGPRGVATLHHEDAPDRRLTSEAPAQAVDLDASGRYAALGHARGVEIWDARARRTRGLTSVGNRLGRLVWSPGGRWIAGVTDNGGIELWHADSGDREILRAAGPAIESLFFASDDGALVVADGRPRLISWDLVQDPPVERDLPLLGGPHSVIAARGLADGGVLQWSRDSDGSSIQALTRAGEQLWASPRISEVHLASLSPDGLHLALAGRRGRPQLWRVEGSQLRREAIELGGADHRWQAVAHDADSTRTRLAAALERAGEEVIAGFVVWEVAWDGAEGGPTPHVLYEDDGVRDVLRDASGDAVVVLGRDHTHLWHLPSGAIHRVPPCAGELRGFALASEPGRVALVGAGRSDASPDTACFADLASGGVQRLGIGGDPWAWDGRRTFASVGERGDIELWTDPTPEDPAVFLRWLSDRTPEEVPLATLAGHGK